MTIFLKDFLALDNAEDYKLHLACRNRRFVEPLDDFVSGRDNWIAWNEWRGRRNDWTKPFVFSLMDFYPRKDSWLFGGCFKVEERMKENYSLSGLPQFDPYVGRLLVGFHRYQGMRGRAFLLENYIDDLVVEEVFPSPYSGETFCGFERINHDFGFMESVFHRERSDWKAALESVKGVYLITDVSNGKRYVGSAKGDAGIWSRWSCYVATGHGFNDELVALIRKKKMDYARKNFRFSVLEVMVKSTSDEIVIERESHWKRVLLSREFGYNLN